MTKERINIVWLKRDLRLSDHPPLFQAVEEGLPVVILYVFEPNIMSMPEHSDRHWRFIYESLNEINDELEKHEHHLNILLGESLDVFKSIQSEYEIVNIYSHHEVGLKKTFERDNDLRVFFAERNISWLETSQDGIKIGAKNRIGWEEDRDQFLRKNLKNPDLLQLNTVQLNEGIKKRYSIQPLSENIINKNEYFQQGGEKEGRELLQSFLENRYKNYIQNISKPFLTEYSDSRLSAYLAYGCLSMREVFQEVNKNINENNKDILEEFLNRLFWRSHYMQKLETERELEFRSTNKYFDDLNKEYDTELMDSFLAGKTGFPFIDASMQCLKKTGYANFRMRATLVTFATFTLWQDWREVTSQLARLFLDFEPGVHIGQVHIQAGLTGYHILRLFSPTAQSEKHDKEGFFVKKWLPVLNDVPKEFISKPWEMDYAQQKKYNCIIGEDYPLPIVDYEIATHIARGYYWKSRQKLEVFDELPSIFEKHCLPKNIPSYLRHMKINRSAFLKGLKRNINH